MQIITNEGPVPETRTLPKLFTQSHLEKEYSS